MQAGRFDPCDQIVQVYRHLIDVNENFLDLPLVRRAQDNLQLLCALVEFADERLRFEESCKRAGVDLLDVPTRGSVADPIVRFFRMRERRGGRR